MGLIINIKKYIWLIFLSFMVHIGTAFGLPSSNKFYSWDEFQKNFGKEMVGAEDVYKNMRNSGLEDFSYCKFDFYFQSTTKDQLDKLGDFLKSHYQYEVKKIQKSGDIWELSGVTNEVPVTKDNLMYWALDMSKRGYEFDAKLEGYGALLDSKRKPEFIKSKAKFYFDQGVAAYSNGNLSGAIFNFNISIEIMPDKAAVFYSRAVVKNELYTWKAALRDYDKAIELAPNFIEAILNRGGLKDDNGDYAGAIADYDLVIESAKNEDLENKKMAYFNRGNTKMNMNNKNGACSDWQQALDLGAEYATDRIKNYCK